MTTSRERNVVGDVNPTQKRQLRPSGEGQLRIRLLGPMAVTGLDGQPITIASKRGRALIGYLALREGVEVSRGIIVGLLWGERSDNQARASLRQLLSELRGALDDAEQHILVASKDAVRWAPRSAWVDAHVLEAAAASDDEDVLREAADLIGGELMEGLAVDEAGFEQWLAVERERFRLLAGRVFARLMEMAEQAGRLEEAIGSGLKLLSLDPLQEHVHRALMKFYAAQKRHDAALAQYERCRRELSAQLGVQPSPETENLARAIRASRRAGGPPAHEERPTAQNVTKEEARDRQAPPPSDKPSIAVLPFANLSADPEQDHFAEGIVADLITQLSRLRDLLVIARNSTLASRDRSVSVQEIASELGVQSVLEGSVRRSGNRIRVSAQLIDAASGTNIWAERYDRELTDIFELQDEITKAVTVALQVKLTEGDAARIAADGTRSLQAWEAFLQGKAALLTFTKLDNLRARRLLEQAVRHDPNYGLALATLANAHWLDARFRYTPDPAASLEQARAALRRAEQVGGETGAVLFGKGNIALIEQRHDDALACHRRAVELAPSDPECASVLGMTLIFTGDFPGAVATLTTAQRLSPYWVNWTIYYLAFAHLWIGELEQARSEAALYLRREPQEPYAYVLSAIAEAAGGYPAAARDIVARLLARYPDMSCTTFARAQFYRDPQRIEQLLAWLKEAGLPE